MFGVSTVIEHKHAGHLPAFLSGLNGVIYWLRDARSHDPSKAVCNYGFCVTKRPKSFGTALKCERGQISSAHANFVRMAAGLTESSITAIFCTTEWQILAVHNTVQLFDYSDNATYTYFN